MRNLGTLQIENERIPVLVSHWKFGTLLKVRNHKTNHSGVLLTDESNYLKDNPELLAKLKAGEVIKV